MIDILQQQETLPATYPDVPEGLSENAATVDADMIWQRIETYTAHRFTDREIIWTITGLAGDQWFPPIVPVTTYTVEQWTNGAWVSVTLDAGPMGPCLPSDGTYKITAQAGAGPTPAAISEAFRRMVEYLGGARGSTNEPGATRASFKIGDSLDFEVERNPAWIARAMQFSGAADLLRRYRRG